MRQLIADDHCLCSTGYVRFWKDGGVRASRCRSGVVRLEQHDGEVNEE